MTNLWTTSETTGPPSQIVIEYKNTKPDGTTEQKSQAATSTTFGRSITEYLPLSYTDRDGKPQTSEVAVRKTESSRTTIAAVNPGYVSWRLSKKLGLPSGDALSQNITTSQYITTVDGPQLISETTEQYISMAQFAGGLQLEEWGDFRPSGGELVLSHKTVRKMDYAKTSEGRDVTRTLTERYIAAAESSEWKNYAAKAGKAIKGFPEAIEPFVRGLVPLVYEGTEVQIETGRIPVPSKPSNEEIARQEVANGSGDIPSDATPADVYGNDKGWTSYIPDASGNGNWQQYNQDSNNDGVPDWDDYVPQSWEDYNVPIDDPNRTEEIFDVETGPYFQVWDDTPANTTTDPDAVFELLVTGGVIDYFEPGSLDLMAWEPYVPATWNDYDKDTDGDGIPDWRDYVPITWPEFDQDSSGDGVPDWAPFVPTEWPQFSGDSDGDGVPDWAPFVPDPINWQDYNQDSNNDGVPDWAEYVPTTWEDYNQDSNDDGIPDWAPYIPTDWTDYNQDSNDDGVPDWAPYVPTGDDFNTDSNGDGVPDWAPYVPTGPGDFSTADTDFTTTTTEVTNDKVITGVVLFNGATFNPDDSTVTASYDMPFAPDDYFEYVKGVRKLIPGGSLAAAQAFGRTESALDVGHAYGQNIVTGWNEVPTLDLSPLYVRQAGIEGAFLMDSISYAWGPDGMVASSDLMLLGVSGWYGTSQPATSWLRLPVPVSGLQQASAGTTGTAIKANSIPLPADFSARNPAPVLAALPNTGADWFGLYRSSQTLVGPTLQLDQVTLAAGPLLIAREFAYALTLPAETAVLATGPAIVESTAVIPPVATIGVAALDPVVVSGASVAVPAAEISAEALAPVVASGASVAVPAATVGVAGLVPELIGRQRKEIVMPAAGVAVVGLAPVVVRGASIAVPAAGVAVAGLAPSAVGAFDPNFSNVSLLLHMNGSNGSSTFTDSSSAARTVTRSGNAQISTAQSKFGGASGLFDGASDYLEVASNAAFDLSADFAIELWIYQDSSPSATFPILLERGASASSSNYGIILDNSTATTSGAFFYNSPRAFVGLGSIAKATWVHIAITRSGTSLRTFNNGSLIDTQAISNNFTSTSSLVIGGSGNKASNWYKGNIDDLRITKGVARYTATFTPPTAPFPDA